MNLMELKAKAKQVLLTCNSCEEIAALVKEMIEFSKQPWLDKENYSYVESTVCKLQIKRHVLLYYGSKYNEEEFKKLVPFFEKIIKLATAKNYTSTLALAKNYKNVLEQINPHVKDINAIINTMHDSSGVRLLNTTHEYQLIKENMQGRIEQISKITRVPLFPKDVIKDPLDDAIELLKVVQEKADHYIQIVIKENEENFLKNNTNDIKNILKLRSTFYPDLDIEEKRYAKALVINTPYLDELRLFVRAFAEDKKINISVIKSAIFERMKEAEIIEAFGILKKHNIHCLIEGLSNLSNGNIKKCLYENILDYSKNGFYAFMFDDVGDNGLYKEFMDLCNASEGKYTLLDISSTYLSMPSFGDLIQLLIEKNIISNNLDPIVEKIKTGMPFMGFRGLNEIFVAMSSNQDWIEIGTEISNKNYTSEVKEYLSRIPNQSLLVDTGWGDFSKGFVRKEIDRKEFDYDTIRYAKPENIKKIIESGFTIFEKCGLITRYCLLCGDDRNVWTTLDREIQQNRVEEATRLVFQVLGIYNIVPKVEILDELSLDGAGGLCCDGGKLIQFQYKSAQSYEWLIECICHESFHAFQHMAEFTTYCRWFWTELGVTPGRVEEWRLNHKPGVYFNQLAKDFHRYRHQIIEADANAFEKDCAQSGERVWNQIDFE